jgi:hypothetical protein
MYRVLRSKLCMHFFPLLCVLIFPPITFSFISISLLLNFLHHPLSLSPLGSSTLLPLLHTCTFIQFYTFLFFITWALHYVGYILQRGCHYRRNNSIYVEVSQGRFISDVNADTVLCPPRGF